MSLPSGQASLYLADPSCGFPRVYHQPNWSFFFFFAEQKCNGRAQPSLSPLWIGGCSSCTLIQFSLSGLFPVFGLRVLLKLLHVTGPDVFGDISTATPTRGSPGHISSSGDCLTH